MVLNERNVRHDHLLSVAKQMMIAARTAPKGKGIDILEVATITDEEIKILSNEMKNMYEKNSLKFFFVMPIIFFLQRLLY